jgi:hypothetical protein
VPLSLAGTLVGGHTGRGRGGNNFTKVENMDLKNGEGESKVDGMEY